MSLQPSLREDQIVNAFRFLSDPSVASYSDQQKKSFLLKKGLFDIEIDEALQRIARATAAGAAIVAQSKVGQGKYQASLWKRVWKNWVVPAALVYCTYCFLNFLMQKYKKHKKNSGRGEIMTSAENNVSSADETSASPSSQKLRTLNFDDSAFYNSILDEIASVRNDAVQREKALLEIIRKQQSEVEEISCVVQMAFQKVLEEKERGVGRRGRRDRRGEEGREETDNESTSDDSSIVSHMSRSGKFSLLVKKVSEALKRQEKEPLSKETVSLSPSLTLSLSPLSPANEVAPKKDIIKNPWASSIVTALEGASTPLTPSPKYKKEVHEAGEDAGGKKGEEKREEGGEEKREEGREEKREEGREEKREEGGKVEKKGEEEREEEKREEGEKSPRHEAVDVMSTVGEDLEESNNSSNQAGGLSAPPVLGEGEGDSGETIANETELGEEMKKEIDAIFDDMEKIEIEEGERKKLMNSLAVVLRDSQKNIQSSESSKIVMKRFYSRMLDAKARRSFTHTLFFLGFRPANAASTTQVPVEFKSSAVLNATPLNSAKLEYVLNKLSTN